MSNRKLKVKNLNINEWGHQGDVVLTKVDSLPNDAVKQNNTTLALGEVTGHHHTGVGQCEQYMSGNQKYLVIMGDAELQHQEHADITLPVGIYKVDIQREFDLVEGVRKVMD